MKITLFLLLLGVAAAWGVEKGHEGSCSRLFCPPSVGSSRPLAGKQERGNPVSCEPRMIGFQVAERSKAKPFSAEPVLVKIGENGQWKLASKNDPGVECLTSYFDNTGFVGPLADPVWSVTPPTLLPREEFQGSLGAYVGKNRWVRAPLGIAPIVAVDRSKKTTLIWDPGFIRGKKTGKVVRAMNLPDFPPSPDCKECRSEGEK